MMWPHSRLELLQRLSGRRHLRIELRSDGRRLQQTRHHFVDPIHRVGRDADEHRKGVDWLEKDRYQSTLSSVAFDCPLRAIEGSGTTSSEWAIPQGLDLCSLSAYRYHERAPRRLAGSHPPANP